jgi:hypothetical protein
MHAGSPRGRKGLTKVRGSVASTSVGTTPMQRHQSVAVHGSTAALPHSGEESRAPESEEGEIRGHGRLVTSKGSLWDP